MPQDVLSAPAAAQWEPVVLRDLCDCLLDAYELVSQRAHQRYLLRGGCPGEDWRDWFGAERDLIRRLPVEVEEASTYISALATVPAHNTEELEVGIESRWLVILVRPRIFGRAGHSRGFAGDARGSACVSPPRAEGVFGGGIFCVTELPAEVDPASSLAVLSRGLLGIRMLKKAAAKR
ncbi:MAG TPA: hypothetical protein VMU43_04200 [Candidatus Acidoferrum sp.]|nr:hypothetical protein [Candidatus Acidoferrum sp.]